VNALRTLLLGETWALPVGVAALAGLAIGAHAVGPDWWPDAAGPLLLALATILVLVSVRRSARPSRATHSRPGGTPSRGVLG
jgi:hypothetical protein